MSQMLVIFERCRLLYSVKVTVFKLKFESPMSSPVVIAVGMTLVLRIVDVISS